MNGRARLVAGLLLVSGGCALVYQVTWLREFRLIFGGATMATSAVLAVFLGGLGFGNLLLGGWAERHPRPLRLYAQLELGIALAAAASPLVMALARLGYVATGGQATLGVTTATLVRLGITLLVLGLPTFLMGGTLPAAAKAVSDAADKSRRGVALIYGANTLGAVVGTLLSTFVLLPELGTRMTLWLACAVNVALAVVAWRCSTAMLVGSVSAAATRESRRERKRNGPNGESLTEDALAASPRQRLPAAAIYVTALIVGGQFLMLELVWYRMLAPLLGGTTYTFGLILAIALAGMGLGSAMYPWLFSRRRPTAVALAVTAAMQAVAIALPFALGDRIALWSAVLAVQFGDDFSQLAGGWSLIAAILVFPASVASGVQFPLLISLLGEGETHVARQVGLAFACNTVGCIVGSLAGGFGLLPLLSAPGAWVALAIVTALLALAWTAAAYRAGTSPRALAAPLLGSFLALGLLSATGPTAVWRHSYIHARPEEAVKGTPNQHQKWLNDTRRSIYWQEDGREASIAIRAQAGYSFYVNGKSDGHAYYDAQTQILLGLIPATIHPDPRHALVIGLGTGETAGWLAAVAEVQRVDVVELEPAIKKVAELCAPMNQGALENPKLTLWINDAREMLTTAPERYDLIISEPSNPFRAGIANLFTREFYASCKARLRPGGILSQWLQAYDIDAATVALVLRTLKSEFAHVELWHMKGGDLMLLASSEPLAYDVPLLRARLSEEPRRTGLRVTWRAEGVEGLLSGYLGGAELVAALAAAPGDTAINTDDHNRLEYAFARLVGKHIDFKISEWRNLARELGAHRPRLQGGDIDWETAGDYFALSYVREQNLIPPMDVFTAAQRLRREALNAGLTGRHDEAVKLWDQQPRPPRHSTELAVMINAYLNTDDPRMTKAVETLRTLEPIEADAMAAAIAMHQGDTDLAINLTERVLLQLRHDPWPRYISHIFGQSIRLAQQNPTSAPRLLEALDQPFAAAIRQEDRRNAALMVSSFIGGAELIQHLDSYEPNPLWIDALLQVRAEVYAAAGHPLAARAARDWERYQALEK